MDTVPYDFVASVMRVRLSGLWFDEFKECALLGANYGTIATETADRTLNCFVDIPGMLIDNPFAKNGEVSRQPFFLRAMDKVHVEVSSFSPVDLLFFAVSAGDQLFETSENLQNGISPRQFRSMMQSCGFAAYRVLVISAFYSDTLLRQLDSFFSTPNLASFFNAVIIPYQETASFKKLFFMIADRMMLKHLRLDIIEDTNSAPVWFQETLTRIFFQPQFDLLTFSPHNAKKCSWAHAFVDNLVVRWMKTPETFPKSSKTIGYPYHAFLTSPDLLSKYEFHKVERPGRLAYRRFDCAHPTEMERRMIAKVYDKKGYAHIFTNTTDNYFQDDSSDYWFCLWARQMMLTFAHNDGDMALSKANLNCSPRTVKQERYPLIVLSCLFVFSACFGFLLFVLNLFSFSTLDSFLTSFCFVAWAISNYI
uniref:Nucleotid_trans domain-containing protein n=1 Tax=Steinernema glaseri TaxID=37863 RepID=A0A1I7ZLM8_9BILA